MNGRPGQARRQCGLESLERLGIVLRFEGGAAGLKQLRRLVATGVDGKTAQYTNEKSRECGEWQVRCAAVASAVLAGRGASDWDARAR
jgi:hypothetical protein